MTVLVTGTTGLVGARLIPRLRNLGYSCRALVRSGNAVEADAATALGDLNEPATLHAALEGVTAVVHLAALLRSPDGEQIWRTNLDGTQNLIAAVSSRAPAARFVMASTGLVYGRDGSRPGHEEDECAPKMPYPASKLAAEGALRASGLNWSILRLGFVYGDGDGHIASVPRLADVLKWHPANRLSLIHHRDVAGAVRLALEGRMDRQMVNVVDDAPTTILELSEIAGGSLPPADQPLSDPWSGHLDGSRLRALGFRPQVRSVHQAAEEGVL